MHTVTLYTTDHCSRCASAKVLLGRRGIGYEEINLARDPDGRAELIRRTGMQTFPQVVIGEETLGGFDELLAADRQGRLRQLQAVQRPAGPLPAAPLLAAQPPAASLLAATPPVAPSLTVQPPAAQPPAPQPPGAQPLAG